MISKIANSCGCVKRTLGESRERHATDAYGLASVGALLDLDPFGELTGIGAYPTVARLSVTMPVYDRDVQVLSLDGLERAKRAAGRLEDLADLAEIQEIRRLTRRYERGRSK